jgi:AbrB family looped-hinge helix DNA binding protein
MSKGFGEEAQAPLSPPLPSAKSAAAEPLRFKLKLGPGGRVVIPAEVRAAMGLTEGDVLFATFDGEEIKAVTVATSVRRVQEVFRTLAPDCVSLSDELIADRRREQEREDRGE